jgi:hypothetical protein
LSQGGLQRSRAPGANPRRNSCANCAGAGSQDSYDGSRVGCVPRGPMRDRAAYTPRWGQESGSHSRPRLRRVRIDVNSRLVTASPPRQSSAGYITNIDRRRRPRNPLPDICGPQRTRRRRVRTSRTGIGVHRHEEVANQRLPVLQRLQSGPNQVEVSYHGDTLGAGRQPNLMIREF